MTSIMMMTILGVRGAGRFMKAWILALFFSVTAPVWAQPQVPPLTQHFQDTSSLRDWIAGLKSLRRPDDPPPPRLPRKFRWTGRYIVSDLIDPRTGKRGIEVPFVWFGQDGNVQMIAGGDKYPIHFTNFIYMDHLYTYTYRWPGLQFWFLPPFETCKPLFKLSLDDLNAFLATSRYAGAAILQDRTLRYVHHFRLSLVVPPLPSGAYPRFAVLLGDFFVDQRDSSKFWQVLHFGYQNLYDPELDEWIIIDKFEKTGGKMILPDVIVLP